jgi:hypothetical protein
VPVKASLGSKTDSTIPFHDYESSDEEQDFVVKPYNSKPYTDKPQTKANKYSK